MNASEILSSWVPIARKRLGLLGNNVRDEDIFKAIITWRDNLWTNHYKLDLVNGKIPNEHPWAFDEKTLEATLLYVSFHIINPTGEISNNTTVNNVIATIGSRQSYK